MKANARFFFSFVSDRSVRSSLRQKNIIYTFIYTLLKEKVQKYNSIYSDSLDGKMSTVLSFLYLVKCKRLVNYAFGGQVTPLYTDSKFFAINFHTFILLLFFYNYQSDMINSHYIATYVPIFYYLRFLQNPKAISHLIVSEYLLL